MTSEELISAALRRANLLSPGESLDAETATDCLESLNLMVTSWELESINMGWDDLAITDTVPIADNQRAHLVACLAVRLAGDVGKPVSQVLADDSVTAKRVLRSAFYKPERMTIDPALRSRVPWQRW